MLGQPLFHTQDWSEWKFESQLVRKSVTVQQLNNKRWAATGQQPLWLICSSSEVDLAVQLISLILSSLCLSAVVFSKRNHFPLNFQVPLTWNRHAKVLLGCSGLAQLFRPCFHLLRSSLHASAGTLLITTKSPVTHSVQSSLQVPCLRLVIPGNKMPTAYKNITYSCVFQCFSFPCFSI